MVRLKVRRQTWDRFVYWAPGAALLVLVFSCALLLAASLLAASAPRPVPAPADLPSAASAPAAPTLHTGGDDATRDTDLQLYDAIAARVRGGENYYVVAVEEQRARNFPVRPGLAVRLPTLAFVSAGMGEWGMMALAALLAIAVVLAWWRRTFHEPGGHDYRTFVLLLLVIGAASGFKPQYLALHEVWSGMCIALSVGLHRPGHWHGAWLAAALALLLRELALPYVVLMGAMALWRGHLREAVGWSVLVALFAAVLVVHLAQIDALTSTSDRLSPGWLAVQGINGWTSKVVLSSPLHLLPMWVAAPLALLPLVGWAGWRCSLGNTGFLLCLGYGVFFMIAGRDNNFYWALMVMPVWFIGLALLPRTLVSLTGAVGKM